MVTALAARVHDAEAEINALFGVDADERAAVEEALAGRYRPENPVDRMNRKRPGHPRA